MTLRNSSIIILSWNGTQHLVPCLTAVLLQDPPAEEVIVVDNGSTDGSADLVAEQFPQVRLIRNERNLGFAAGNNMGLRVAMGDVLVLLNQDTVVQPGWLEALLSAIQSDPLIGIVGSKALFPDGTIQHAGAYLDNHGIGKHYNYQQADTAVTEQLRDVEYVIGASLAITRQALNAIGELDEGFSPAYYEDVDWCYRARRAGLRVVYTPQSVYTHKESRLAARSDHAGMYLVHRNRLRFLLKHWPIDRLIQEFEPAERKWLENLEQGSETMVAGTQHAYFHYLLHLDKVSALRNQVLRVSEPQRDIEMIAGMLVRLRSIIPLGPARLHASVPSKPHVQDPLPLARHDEEVSVAVETRVLSDVPAPPPEVALGLEELAGGPPLSSNSHDPSSPSASPPDRVQHLLATMRQRSRIHEFQFHSTLPVVGPLVAKFRQMWNKVSTEWYVRHIVQQQFVFNAKTVETLEAMSEQMQVASSQLQAATVQLGRIQWQQQQHQFLLQKLAEYLSQLVAWAVEGQSRTVDEVRAQSEALEAQSKALQQILRQQQGQLNDMVTWLSQQEYRSSLRMDYQENRLTQESYDRERLGQVLGEYIQENGREIAELARAIGHEKQRPAG